MCHSIHKLIGMSDAPKTHWQWSCYLHWIYIHTIIYDIYMLLVYFWYIWENVTISSLLPKPYFSWSLYSSFFFFCWSRQRVFACVCGCYWCAEINKHFMSSTHGKNCVVVSKSECRLSWGPTFSHSIQNTHKNIYI